jgi:hypothetical protein
MPVADADGVRAILRRSDAALEEKSSGRPFPTWSEVVEVRENLGDRKVAPPTEIYKRAK